MACEIMRREDGKGKTFVCLFFSEVSGIHSYLCKLNWCSAYTVFYFLKVGFLEFDWVVTEIVALEVPGFY